MEPALPLLDPASLSTERFGRRVLSFPTVGSTNTAAREAAEEGVEEGAVVVTEQQTSGRGRRGRAWITSPGQSLAFSVILRPDLAPADLGLVQIAGSVSVAETLDEELTGVRCGVKWPNDVMVDDRKICGILTESASMRASADRVEYAVLGVGINVNEDAFPTDISPAPTSILLETGQRSSRARVLQRFLTLFEREYDGLADDGGTSARRKYASRLIGLGSRCTYHAAGRSSPILGNLVGISESGALLVRDDRGELLTLRSGEVSTRPATRQSGP